MGEQTTSGRVGRRSAHLSDLGAVVYLGGAPHGLAEELPALYGSLFCTEPWFRTFDGAAAGGACVLERPRHELLPFQGGDTIEVLNKAFPTAARDLLGAAPVRATRLSVFCSRVSRLSSVGEARATAWHNLKRESRREYWRSRHAAGAFLRAVRPGAHTNGHGPGQ